ncbi:type VII secretion protein EsaA [Oceanobacillus arenosus]|uniref:Type VII secretion system accessory factor EsaA n=1 Tax=Oceanobacillus arenosus TaxID=1229153 RepID=A0A3D8PMU1_9BACI|nr:type VII secretion protein EsaA [Oceanobacillus arenosus]RDW16465.1 type VII secretion protein EsaA [Oceanobacillus arenosus]
MKYIDKRWLLFLILIILLASGLTYLAFNQEVESIAKNKLKNETQHMAIALVNEDQGAEFNGEKLAFGDTFVRSVDKNNNHEWYVVSRGVAESGLDSNTYDMMIVIPNDFSTKALSIELENPEQVVLNYKINASDNERVRAEAEKTASNILNDFNRRIIDVYFASIIGNLQNAQDNIGRIIDQQSLYTTTYNNNVYSPLDYYTSQFGAIKDDTQLSIDSFSTYEEIMATFEQQLVEDAELGEGYLTSLYDASQLKASNSASLLGFYDSLNLFDSGLNDGNVEVQLQQLQAANALINHQFSQKGEQSINTLISTQSTGPSSGNIVDNSAKIQVHLQNALKQVEETQGKLNSRLNPEKLHEEVSAKLSDVMSSAFVEDEQLNINTLFENPDKNARNYINEQISRLPSLNEEDFGGDGLSEQTLTEIKNVIAVTNKYNREIEYVAPLGNGEEILSREIKAFKAHLNTNGVTIRDTVILPENKKSGQTFELNIPAGYTVKNLSIVLPGVGEADYTAVYHSSGNGVLKLPANKEGEFTLNVTLQLLNQNSVIDIYEPVSLSWKLHQEDITDVDNPDHASLLVAQSPLIASVSIIEGNIDQKTGEAEDSGTLAPSELVNDPEDIPATEEDVDQTDNPASLPEEIPAEDPNETDSNNSPEEGSDDAVTPPDSENDTNQPDDDEEAPIEKVSVINNTIQHVVMSPVTKMDNTTQLLIHTVSNTVSPYQKLFSLYESYFGLDMDNPELRHNLNGKALKEWATEEDTSLYYLFNEKDIAELLKDYVVAQVTDGVTKEIRQPLENLQLQISMFHEQVEQAEQSTTALAEKIVATSNQALVLNENLGEMLENVADWRDNSLSLIEKHTEIQANDDGENTAMLTLGEEFQTIFTASQSLADQAQGNLNTAETVYQTFENIDEQATEIQDSGVNLVSDAETLSINMTDKVIEDQAFADNFAGVLANSRVGERQNENFYDFLSNPVQVSNGGTITSNNNFTPYFLVLIGFIVVLFTAYVISTINQKKVDKDQFSDDTTLMGQNAPITLITAGIGVMEGIVIGVVSNYFLPNSNINMILFTSLMILLITGMLLIATYLLRQLKMTGMFLLLIILSLYLFSTNALGFGIEGTDILKTLSPLQYVERLLFGVAQNTANYLSSYLMIIGIIIVGVLANLLVLNKSNEGDIDDESEVEAG